MARRHPSLTSATPIRRWIRAQLPHAGVSYLVLFVNTRCEQNCAHCFVREGLDKELMTPTELSAVGRHLPNLLQLTVTGGEPTLRRDFPEAVSAIAKASRVPFISVHTNGFVPERIERHVRELLHNVPDASISIRLSLDGFGGLHDEIRRQRESWDRATETLARLQELRRRDSRLRLFTDTVLQKANRDRLGDLIGYLESQEDGIDGRELIYLRGSPRDPDSAEVGVDDYRAALAQFSPELSRAGRGEVALSLPEAARREMYRQILAVADGRAGARGCVAGDTFAVLGAQGEVSACEIPGGGGVLGNIRTDGPDIQAILQSARGREARRRILRGDCAAGCSYECAALATISLRGPRLAGALARVSAPLATGTP